MKERGWNHSEGYLQLWEHFDRKFREKVDWIYRGFLPDLIIWDGNRILNGKVPKHLIPSRYVIQLWMDSVDDKSIKDLINQKNRLILTTSVHDKSIDRLQHINLSYSDQATQESLLGGEIAMPTEVSDETEVWSKVAILADQFWSDPKANKRIQCDR